MTLLPIIFSCAHSPVKEVPSQESPVQSLIYQGFRGLREGQSASGHLAALGSKIVITRKGRVQIWNAQDNAFSLIHDTPTEVVDDVFFHKGHPHILKDGTVSALKGGDDLFVLKRGERYFPISIRDELFVLGANAIHVGLDKSILNIPEQTASLPLISERLLLEDVSKWNDWKKTGQLVDKVVQRKIVDVFSIASTDNTQLGVGFDDGSVTIFDPLQRNYTGHFQAESDRTLFCGAYVAQEKSIWSACALPKPMLYRWDTQGNPTTLEMPTDAESMFDPSHVELFSTQKGLALRIKDALWFYKDQVWSPKESVSPISIVLENGDVVSLMHDGAIDFAGQLVPGRERERWVTGSEELWAIGTLDGTYVFGGMNLLSSMEPFTKGGVSDTELLVLSDNSLHRYASKQVMTHQDLPPDIVSFSRAGQSKMFALADRRGALWLMKEGLKKEEEQPEEIDLNDGSIIALSWSRDGKHLLVGTDSGSVYWVDTEQKNLLHFASYGQPVVDVGWNDGIWVALEDASVHYTPWDPTIPKWEPRWQDVQWSGRKFDSNNVGLVSWLDTEQIVHVQSKEGVDRTLPISRHAADVHWISSNVLVWIGESFGLYDHQKNKCLIFAFDEGFLPSHRTWDTCESQQWR